MIIRNGQTGISSQIYLLPYRATAWINANMAPFFGLRSSDPFESYRNKENRQPAFAGQAGWNDCGKSNPLNIRCKIHFFQTINPLCSINTPPFCKI
jgi:hypothetical protein